MPFEEDLEVALPVVAEGACLLEGLLPPPEAGVQHEVVAEPVEGQHRVLLLVLEDLSHSVLLHIH